MKYFQSLMTLVVAIAPLSLSAASTDTYVLSLGSESVGAEAKLLLETLPPAPNFAIDGSIQDQQQKKHFRKLVIPINPTTSVELQCASATWQHQGFGRTSQMVLVADTPNCSAELNFAVPPAVAPETNPLPLAEILKAAAAANAISVSLPQPEISFVDCPPNSRICK